MTLIGRVGSFDTDQGLGSIVADDGTTYRFHCITIADGTRTIDTGRRVAFTLRSRFGQPEAVDIVKL
jgi:cold shock CspA family protein